MLPGWQTLVKMGTRTSTRTGFVSIAFAIQEKAIEVTILVE
jgi:hypothetical protein